MFLVRGILQVTLTPLSDGLDGMVSGFAGIGDVILGVSLLLLLVFIYLNVFKKEETGKGINAKSRGGRPTSVFSKQKPLTGLALFDKGPIFLLPFSMRANRCSALA